MQTYWSILEKVRGSSLRLTKMDDDIYKHLQEDFPEFDPAETINEEEMKSKTGKERWRKFMTAYEKVIDDYNFGTMLRSNPKWEYGKDETIFGIFDLHFHCLRTNSNSFSAPDAVLCRRDSKARLPSCRLLCRLSAY
jgi:Polysaccharide biosynthesis